MSLPTEKRKPRKELCAQTMVVYGACKIGKSSFCSNIDGALFISTEPGLNALEVYEAPVASWPAFTELCAEIAADKSGKFKTLVIDTVDNLFQFCESYVLEKNKISHPSDMGYGKGYGLVNGEFSRVIKKLSMLPFGMVFISHSKVKEMDSRTGKVQKTTMSMPEGARQELLKLADMVLLFDTERKPGSESERRVIRTRASFAYDAGSRWEIEDPIDMSWSAFKAAYEKATVPVSSTIATTKTIKK